MGTSATKGQTLKVFVQGTAIGFFLTVTLATAWRMDWVGVKNGGSAPSQGATPPPKKKKKEWWQ